MLKADLLNSSSKIDHGFFTRQGGRSTGLFDSLNCGLGSGDNPTLVQHNRDVCAKALGVHGGNLITAKQQHTADAVTIFQPWNTRAAPTADAIVTRTPGIAIGVLTADCAPVLLADPVNGVIGAAHAGWKGALAGYKNSEIA